MAGTMVTQIQTRRAKTELFMQKHHSQQNGHYMISLLCSPAPCNAMSPAEQRAGVRGAAAGGEAGPLEPGTRPRVSAPGSLQPPRYNLSRTRRGQYPSAPVCTAAGLVSTVMCSVLSTVMWLQVVSRLV